MNNHYKDFEIGHISLDIDNDKLGDEFAISEDGSSESDEEGTSHMTENPDVWLKQIVDPDTYELLSGMLRSDSTDEELQSSFSDILGYEKLDLIIELIQRRQDFIVSLLIRHNFLL